jgi:hypothetical protein
LNLGFAIIAINFHFMVFKWHGRGFKNYHGCDTIFIQTGQKGGTLMNRIGNWRLLLLLVLAFSLFLMPACRPEEVTPAPEPEPEPEPEPARATTVHVVGWGRTEKGYGFPLYWRDGEVADLSVCRYPKPDIGGAYPYSIFVSGSDVYAAGTGSCDYRSVATYWKNGVRTDLTSRTLHYHAKSIYVSGSDVYLAGWIETSGKSIPCYWKNGVRVELSRPTSRTSAEAYAIVVAGADVFVAGTSNLEVNMDRSVSVPCYWKNGVRTDLSVIAPERNGYGNAIYASEGNVYVAGYCVDPTWTGVPCYWLNGVRTDLSRVYVYSGWTGSIQVSGGDVYVAGATGGDACEMIPCYWKNGLRTDLSVAKPGRGGYVNSIFVLGRDVFAAGYSGNDPNVAVDPAIPCYWKNGVRTDLTTASYPEAFATAISATYK